MYYVFLSTSETTYNWPNLEPMQVVFFLLAGEITQVRDAIPRVRCASGNVLLINQKTNLPTEQN